MTAAPEVKVEPNEEQLAVKTEDPAPPAQQQQQQQLTIPDLPKEVLHRILSMTTEQLSFTSRYRNLKSTALVAKAWRGPSQELLCRDAVFHSVATIQRWLEVSFLLLFREIGEGELISGSLSLLLDDQE